MNPDIKPVVSANSKFSIDLLKVLCKDNTENVIFSPLSISSALGLVLLGAGHNTADQMNKVRLNLQIALYKLKSHVYECFKVDLLCPFLQGILYRYSGKKNCNRIKYKTKQEKHHGAVSTCIFAFNCAAFFIYVNTDLVFFSPIQDH